MEFTILVVDKTDETEYNINISLEYIPCINPFNLVLNDKEIPNGNSISL